MEKLLQQEICSLMEQSLAEDKADDDTTSHHLIEEDAKGGLVIKAQGTLVMAGGMPLVASHVKWGGGVKVVSLLEDGNTAQDGTDLMMLEGRMRLLLGLERSLLNLLHMTCAIATTTRSYHEALKGTHTELWDTRKTIPAMRHLSKYAARMGGAHNHRSDLKSGIFVKDNHLDGCGGVKNALSILHSSQNNNAILECDTLDDAMIAIQMGASWILLDNMEDEIMRKIIDFNQQANQGRTRLEASGDITIERAKILAKMGLDGISVGAMTLFPHRVTMSAHWSRT